MKTFTGVLCCHDKYVFTSRTLLNYRLDILTLLSVYIRSTTTTVIDCSPAFYWWTLFWSHDHCCCYAEVVVVTVGEELGQFRNPGLGSGWVRLCRFPVLLRSFWQLVRLSWARTWMFSKLTLWPALMVCSRTADCLSLAEWSLKRVPRERAVSPM